MLVADSSYLLNQFFIFFAPLFAFCGFVYFSILVFRRFVHV